ncbi:MAG: DUF1622 domain-containing protein [Halobacteriota archaeon]
MFEDITNWATLISWIVTFFELVGAIIIFYGSARVVVELVTNALRRRTPNYTAIRLDFTSKIVLALELFVANDLVRTILSPTLDQAVILAFVVGIRIVVGLSLNRELRELGK